MPVLKLTLLRIENLKNEDGIGGTSDPYVKFSVDIDGWFSDETVAFAQSTKKSGEQNPEYNEEFTFTIQETNNRLLKIEVMDDDWGSDEKLGGATINLGDEGLEPGEDKEMEICVDDGWFSDAKLYCILNWEGGEE